MILPQRAAANLARYRAAALRARARGHVRQPLPRQAPPTRIEASYVAVVRGLVTRTAARAYAPLLRALPSLVEQARQERGDAADWRSDGTHSGRSASAAVSAAAADMKRSVTPGSVSAAARKAGQDVDDHNRLEVGKQLRAVLGVDLMGDPSQRALIEGFVHENVKLITGLTDAMAADVERVLLAGLTGGHLHEMLAKTIQRRLDIAAERAELIAVDQIGKINGQVNIARFRAMGLTRFRWRTVGDERVRGKPGGRYPNARPSHDARDLVVYPIDDPPKGQNGEPEWPGTPIRCRCGADPMLEDVLADETGAQPGPVVVTGQAGSQPTTEELEAEAERLRLEVEAMIAGPPTMSDFARQLAAARVAAAPPPEDPGELAKKAAADLADLKSQLHKLSIASLENLLIELREPDLHFRGLPLIERLMIVGEARALVEQRLSDLRAVPAGGGVPPQRVASAPSPTAAGLTQVTAAQHREFLLSAPVAVYAPGHEGVNGSYNGLLEMAGSGMRAKIKPRDEEEVGLHVPANTQYRREAAAAAVGDLLNVGDMMPVTVVRDLGPPFGVSSLQAFHEGALRSMELSDEQEERIDMEAVARMRVFDFAVGNFDRHNNNVMWIDDGKTVKPALVDHGLTFPPERPIGFRCPSMGVVDTKAAALSPAAREAIGAFDLPAIARTLVKQGIDTAAIQATMYRIAIMQADPNVIDTMPGESSERALGRWTAAMRSPGALLSLSRRKALNELVRAAIDEVGS